jgi:cobalt transporter subunit CbtA
MFRRILIAALVAGFAAGVLATAVQAARVWPLILTAETFENAAPADAHQHGTAAAVEAWSPEDGLERTAFTLLFNLLAGFGFALLLNAALVLRRAAGGQTDATTGLLWGLAGFASFALAPALGLPPELPGMVAADLLARQLWWIATALATAGGIALIVLPRRLPAALIGVVLLVVPHVVGAPHPDPAEASPVPAELAAGFVAASLVTAAVFWAALGAVSGWLQHRYG